MVAGCVLTWCCGSVKMDAVAADEKDAGGALQFWCCCDCSDESGGFSSPLVAAGADGARRWTRMMVARGGRKTCCRQGWRKRRKLGLGFHV